MSKKKKHTQHRNHQLAVGADTRPASTDPQPMQSPQQAFCRRAVWQEMAAIDAHLDNVQLSRERGEYVWTARRRGIAEARRHLLENMLGDVAQQESVIRHCKDDILYWFRYFAWTFDPRPQRVGIPPSDSPPNGGRTNPSASFLTPSPLGGGYAPAIGEAGGRGTPTSSRAIGKLPMVLYPYQMETVLRINEAIANGDDALIEKSRDMGLSWLVCLVFQYRWMFCDDQQFLIGSRNAASADTRGDLSSLLEKVRFNLREQPDCLLPQGFEWRKHDVGGKLLNPDNGNTIITEAATENFARGGRYSGILMDEFAFWPTADAAYAAAGQSSYCRIVVSTPNGRYNRFAIERFSGLNPVITLHWRLHPLKDETWYAAQCRRLLPHEIARELDINYEKSTRDRVFNEFGPQNVKAGLQPVEGKKITRVWDFGYHTPAVLFMQVDTHGRLMVLREVVGEQVVLAQFVEDVIKAGNDQFGESASYDDYCDPAGHQHNDKSELTSIEVLKNAGIDPDGVHCPIGESIEKVRHLCVERRDIPVAGASESEKANPPKGFKLIGSTLHEESVALLLDDLRCPTLLQAMQGGYRYRDPEREELRQEHPFEDVADCLRYGAWAMLPLKGDGKRWEEDEKRKRKSVLEAKQRNRDNERKHKTFKL